MAIYISIYIYLYIYISISIQVHIYISVSIYLSIYLSIDIYLSIYLSIYLPNYNREPWNMNESLHVHVIYQLVSSSTVENEVIFDANHGVLDFCGGSTTTTHHHHHHHHQQQQQHHHHHHHHHHHQQQQQWNRQTNTTAISKQSYPIFPVEGLALELFPKYSVKLVYAGR